MRERGEADDFESLEGELVKREHKGDVVGHCRTSMVEAFEGGENDQESKWIVDDKNQGLSTPLQATLGKWQGRAKGRRKRLVEITEVSDGKNKEREVRQSDRKIVCYQSTRLARILG